MGWMFLKIGDLTDASNCFMQALNEADANSDSFFGLGMSLAIHGDYEGALECLDQAIILQPDRFELRLCAGWIYYKLEKWDNVLECLGQCPGQEPFRSRYQQLQRAVHYKKFLGRFRKLFERIWRRG
jgi:tetratricopeptide (TPR) repeat protein